MHYKPDWWNTKIQKTYLDSNTSKYLMNLMPYKTWLEKYKKHTYSRVLHYPSTCGPYAPKPCWWNMKNIISPKYFVHSKSETLLVEYEKQNFSRVFCSLKYDKHTYFKSFTNLSTQLTSHCKNRLPNYEKHTYSWEFSQPKYEK